MSSPSLSNAAILLSPTLYSSFDSTYAFIAPPSPTFSMFESADLWAPTLSDDSDTHSLLSHSSSDDASMSAIIGSVELSEQDFIDAMPPAETFNFEAKFIVEASTKSAPAAIANVAATVAVCEPMHTFKFERAQAIIEHESSPVRALTSAAKKSSKRRSSNESSEFTDSSEPKSKRRVSMRDTRSEQCDRAEAVPVQALPLRCEPLVLPVSASSSTRSVSSASSSLDSPVIPLADASSLARVDASLVSSLLAESALKKNRLARKAELARLGRRAKTQQIELLEDKVRQLNQQLAAIRDRKPSVAHSGSLSDIAVKIEANNAAAVTDALSAVVSLAASGDILVPRFLAWFAGQKEKFVVGVCDKQLRCDAAQTRAVTQCTRRRER